MYQANKGLFHVHREPAANLERINQALSLYLGELTLFHYSGHAGRDSLFLVDAPVNAAGIAFQLKESARRGVLKLVVLNGCSTAGQVKKLLEAGVPSVIATNAPVGDKSATEFAIRFYHNICLRRMTILEAFTDAKGAAQLATMADLGVSKTTVRGIGYLDELDESAPLWELFSTHPDNIHINPLPSLMIPRDIRFEPNELLTQTIFDALAQTGNKRVLSMKEEEKSGGEVTLNDKQKAIIKYLPFPISSHLQKLFTSVDGSDGYDKMGLRRLEQMGRAYHIVMEFLTFILIAQLWELKLKGMVKQLPDTLKMKISNYFYLNAPERVTFDYFSFIKALRAYFDELNDGQGTDFFVKELNPLQEHMEEGKEFSDACHYLNFIWTHTRQKLVDEQRALELCSEAEVILAQFFKHLGFLHHYTLTSIQKIQILKYRHNLRAHFSHQIIRLMDAFGTPERNY
ncbi:MAG TPA: CHAT domain-containing protein, partial [Chitinophagaceae bacterium]|nr:CHAT domain-containing protein [Chitinophagaceae bacterium]